MAAPLIVMDTTFNKSLLTIPKDLQLFICNFLDKKDLDELQKTCQILYDVSIDRNSLYHLTILSYENIYSHRYVSQIKSLKIEGYGDKANELKFNQNWYKTVISIECWFYLESIQKFQNLQKCLLQCTGTRLLIDNKINCQRLTYLKLDDCPFTHQLLMAMLKCINLETLILKCMQTQYFSNTIINDENNKMFENHKLNPFHRLNYVKIDSAILKFAPFIHWILSNQQSHKILELADPSNNISKLFTNDTKMSLYALKTIKQIIISNMYTICDNKICSLLNNIYESLQRINQNTSTNNKITFKISNLDLTLKSTLHAPFQENLLSIIYKVVRYFNHSRLFLAYNHQHQDKRFNIIQSISSKILTENAKFDVLQIHQRFEINDKEFYDFIKDNITKYTLLKEKGSEIGRKMIEKYEEMIKPFLMINQNIMHQIGMKYCCLKLYVCFDIVDDAPQDFFGHLGFFNEKYNEKIQILASIWDNHMFPSLKECINDKYDNSNMTKVKYDNSECMCFKRTVKQNEFCMCFKRIEMELLFELDTLN